MQQYVTYLKRFSVRTPQMLLAPVMAPLEAFEFPIASVHHYVNYDAVDEGPSKTEYFYRNIATKIYMEHVLALDSFEGNPKFLSTALQPIVRKFHAQNKRYRFVKSVAEVNNNQLLAVVNYALIARAYRYQRTFYSDYYRWRNIQQTLWDKVGDIANKSERAQYIFVGVPKVLPSVTRLDVCAEEFNAQVIRRLPSHEALFLLEVWKWLSEEHRESSILGKLSRAQLEKVQLVFQDDSRWIMVNLGKLDDWRFIEGKTDDHAKVKMKPKQLQKYFLRMLMGLTEFRNAPMEAELDNAQGDREARDPDEEPDPAEQSQGAGALEIEEETKPALPVVDEPQEVVKPDLKSKTDLHGQDADFVGRHDKADALAASLDDDLAQLELIESRAEKDFAEGEKQFQASVDESKPIAPESFGNPKEPVDLFRERCDALADDGVLAASQYKRYLKLADESKAVLSPYSNEPLHVFTKVDPAVVKIDKKTTIKDIPTVTDKSMLHSSLITFDKTYINDVMPKDVVGMVSNVQKAGMLVSKYEIEPVEELLGAYDMHTVTYLPIEGKTSTIRFRLPKVKEDGTWMHGGVKYRLRKQRADMPIRKVSPDMVALTSYYGKSFVSRNQRKSNNYTSWLQSQVMAKGLSMEDKTITNLAAANVFDNKFACPRAYSALAMAFKGFTAHGFDFVLDHREREKLADPKTLAALEKGGRVLIGTNAAGDFLVIDANDVLYQLSGKTEQVLDRIEAFLGLADEAPLEYSEARVFGQDLPVGFILAYLLGLDKLIEKLHVKYRTVEAGKRMNLLPSEYALVFSDEALIFDRENKAATLILAGLASFEKTTRTLPIHTFNKRGVYLNLLDALKLGVRYLREIELLDQLYVDPITLELLKQMGEPETYQGLLVRGTQMLISDRHPDLLDMNYMRIRGYERLTGAVYGELVQAVREQKAKGNKATAAIELNPYNVWKKIHSDPSISIVNEINPIENLKEIEAVTFGGVGGRSSRSMVRKTRAYHDNDMGVISESTVDSGDVAINTFLSADPRFNSLRGTSDRYTIGQDGHTSLVSTSALLAPGADKDDPKRVNFIGIQNSHVVSCEGYTQASVRTGYEQVMAHRVSPLFAVTAKADGVVNTKGANGIVVQYNQGGKPEGFELGRVYGESRGMTIPHTLVSRLEPGQKFKKGDIIAYNEGFFEPDLLNPSNVVMRSGILARTVLLESGQTLEDASSISKSLSDKLSTQITKIKNVTVEFTQSIRKLLPAGSAVQPDTSLCFIEDAVTSNADLFDEETLNTLKLLSASSPTAKIQGVIERVEVIYNGELEDMSDSLRELALNSDREIAKRARNQLKRPHTGQALGSVRIGGTIIAPECAMIRFYITTSVGAGVGDKGVFANQMKTVFSEVLPRSMKTESGKEIDAVFGSKSVADRIVSSPDIIGTTNVLLDVIGLKAVSLYRGKK